MSVNQSPQKIMHDIELDILGHHRFLSLHHHTSHEINYMHKAGSIFSLQCPAKSNPTQVGFALQEIQEDILSISNDASVNFSFSYKANKNAQNGVLIKKDNAKAEEAKIQFQDFYSQICKQLDMNPQDHIALTMGKR